MLLPHLKQFIIKIIAWYEYNIIPADPRKYRSAINK